MPGLPNKRSEIEGEIGFYGLAEWWLSTFTPTERIQIEKVAVKNRGVSRKLDGLRTLDSVRFKPLAS